LISFNYVLSFAPLGLAYFSPFLPTACAVGCILSPLRGLVMIPQLFLGYDPQLFLGYDPRFLLVMIPAFSSL